MAPTTTRYPTWLVLAIIGAVFAVLILGAWLITADTEDTQTDDLVNDLCELTTDC